MKIHSSIIFLCLLVCGCSRKDVKATIYIADLTGTKWQISYKSENDGKRVYEIDFQKDGVLKNTHPNDQTTNNDSWQQSRNSVTLKFNRGYAIYKGIIKNAQTIEGTAKNKKGGEWDWEAVKLN